jgi:ribosomal protein S27E
LLIRLRDPTKVKPQAKQPTISGTEKITQLSSIKIEISCPECSRQLRIPQDYSGTVKCPDCANSFEVEDSTKEIEPKEEIIESPSDGKVEISCPDCSQSLRIPSSYEGSVRCPSCKTIFKSSDSEV